MLIKILTHAEGVLVLCFFVLVFASVIFRYVLNNSITWAEQACRLMFAWATCIGIPIILRKRGHVSFDLLYKAGNKYVQLGIDLLTDAIALLFSGWLIFYGIQYLMETSGRVFEGIELPFWTMYAVEPVTGILIIVIILEHLLRLFCNPYKEIWEGGAK